MIHGFCYVEQRDVEIGPDRRCPNDGSLALAPSWGKHTQRWVGGTWAPFIARPEGYAYRPPVFPESKPKPPKAKAAPKKRRGPTLAERLEANARPKTPRMGQPGEQRATCRVCAKPVPQPKTGGRRLDCSARCHRQAQSLNPASASMRDRRIEAVCGHDDRPHHARGMCNTCWNRQYKGARRRVVKPPACTACERADRPVKARGLCELCYRADRRARGLDRQQDRTRQTMAERGMACRECGHDGHRQHRADGLCWACYMKRWRRQQKAGAA